METENQLALLHQPANSGGDMDSTPLCLQKNKRKNFNPRFAESKDDEPLKLKVETNSESEKEEEEQPTPVTFASLMAAGSFEAAARQSEAENKFRDFAFKTMQELLNIYGLSLTFSDVVDAFKQQQQRLQDGTNLEPPTPPRTPASTSTEGRKEEVAKPTITLTPTSKLLAENYKDSLVGSDAEDGQVSKAYSDIGSANYDQFNDSNDSEASDQADSNHSYDSRFSYGRRMMDTKNSQTPLPFLSPMLHLAQLQGEAGEKQLSDYAKYLTKYSTYMDCNSEQCQSDNMREHFHCFNIQCNGRVLSKKEEIIRHLKWHKKRSESLNHGFLRFSSSDDCNPQFPNCQHNRKQTHYHCLYCDKCYISTSDVQMHSNYHRKDSAIYKEGFQRFRATEECNADYCAFYKQKTTHFHCRRCKYTFKNKADMEKHKTYHIKDEQLLKDGFKKFLKADACHFDNCRFSTVCNHIHCVRENCNYVLHSSGQLLSHKRKHERQDSEEAYRRFKSAQKASNSSDSAQFFEASSSMESPAKDDDCLEDGIPKSIIQNTSFLERATTVEEAENMIRQYFSDACTRQSLPSTSADEPLNLKNERAKGLIECFMGTNDPHLHCLIPACEAVLPRNFKDINEHIKMHELTRTGVESIPESSNLQQITSIEGFFNRKRGRPPKNRVVEVYNNSQLPPQAIFTSFKLEKSEHKLSPAPSNNNNHHHHHHEMLLKQTLTTPLDRVKIVQPSEKCLETGCIYDSMLHFHCNFSKACHFMTNYSNSMETHLEEFHESVKIPDGFAYFDRNYDCKYLSCENNKVGSHFHCTECQWSFVGAQDMETHICRLPVKSEPESLNLSMKNGGSGGGGGSTGESSDGEVDKKLVVRAAGTFFPENSDPEAMNRASPMHCDRPFCKLKKKVHHHCELCNQAFSDMARLEIHVLKHQSTKLGLIDAERKRLEENSVELVPISRPNTTSEEPQDLSKPQMLIPPGFPADFSQLQNLHLAQLALQYPFYYQNPFMGGFPGLPMPSGLDQPSTSMAAAFPFPNPLELPPPALKRKSETEQAFELTNRIKMMKPSPGPAATSSTPKAGTIKMFKDEPIPTGYLKFRFNEDCNFPNCGYRNHQSHFHCCRQDCYYSFCDKTRFVQHTARHERLDKLMGDDFKQFRANMRCGHDDCAYNKNLGPNNKSSHFHCLKCDFICSDTNKVVAHRRQHSKMEYINAAGFRKIANNERCTPEDASECPYSMKQTHYHCMHCDKVFISRAQLSSHRHSSS